MVNTGKLIMGDNKNQTLNTKLDNKNQALESLKNNITQLINRILLDVLWTCHY